MSAKTSLRSIALAVATLAVHALGIEAKLKEDRFRGTQTIAASGPYGDDNKPSIITSLILVEKLQKPQTLVEFYYRGNLQWLKGEGEAFWLVDGERFSQPTDQEVKDGLKPLERVQTATVVLDAVTCAKILAAKSVEVKIGVLEIVVTKEMLAPVQAVVDLYRAELAKGTLREGSGR
jgi:hypothetical protein